VIAIENVLVSDAVTQEQFVCDLKKCKGACCEEGDAGAPLEKEELDLLKEHYEEIKPYMTPEGRAEVEKQGLYRYDKEFGWVTPTIDGRICAYGHVDKQGIIKCGIEQAYHAGDISWKKPISCHLYPIRIKKSKRGNEEYVNYEPREGLCDPACSLGKKLKVPVFSFLREALERKYGKEFFELLEAAVRHMELEKEDKS
jgi:hypothetical protein